MISINKIREKSGLLLIFLGVTMLAFILGDYFQSNPSTTKMNIGNIYGEDIEAADFEKLVQDKEETYQSVNQTIDENLREQIRGEAWNEIVRTRVLDREMDELGIAVADEEYDDVRFGNNVLSRFKNDPTFQNKATGQFDPANVKQYFSVIQEQYPLLHKTEIKTVLDSRRVAKYNNLIKKGLYVNKIEAEHEYNAENKRVSFSYVVGRFASIADSTVKVTDDEIKAYYNEHKKDVKYKQVESRTIDFVTFDLSPTPADIEATEKSLAALVEPFKTAPSDSAFVVNNSTSRMYQPELYTKGNADPAIDSQIVAAPVGTVIGPFRLGSTVRVVKVVANGKADEANARHILLNAGDGRTVEQQKAFLDSLRTVIKKNNNFADMARQFSKDGSAQDGGNLGWFGQGRMVKPFNDAVFSSSVGEMKIVESEFGVHLVEVTDKRQIDETKLAVIQRPIEPSKATKNSAYEKASSFSINNDTPEKFKAAAEKEKLQIQNAPNIAPQNKYIPGVSDPTQVIRWMNNAEPGDVSEPFQSGTQYVVATLVRITEEGEPAFEDVKDQMKTEVIKKKKADQLLAKMKGANLNAIASSINEIVNNAPDVTFNTPSLPGAGRELKIVGVAMTLPKDKMSKPVIGENGVYILQVNNIVEPTPTKDYKPAKEMAMSRLTGRVDYAAFNALIEKAEVKDLRYKFY